MWHAKTIDEKCGEKRGRGLCQLSAAVLLLLDVVVPSPSWHGRSLAASVLRIHQMIPAGAPTLVAVGLVLAACYWLFRAPVIKHRTLICQKCNRILVNDGRIQCSCGGTLLGEEEMKWTEGVAGTKPGFLPGRNN